MDGNDVLWTLFFVISGLAVFLVVTSLVDSLMGLR